MTSLNIRNRARLGTAMAALALSLGTVTAAAPAAAQPVAARPSETLNLSQGTGTLVRLSAPMSDVFVANDSIADVQVRSATQLYVFGKRSGETTIYATTKSGRVAYAATVRVGSNTGSLDEMMRLAMPDAAIQVTPMNNLVLLTGTVASPGDVEEAAAASAGLCRHHHASGQPDPLGNPVAGRAPGQDRRSQPSAWSRRLDVNLLGRSKSFDVLQGEGIYLPPVGEAPPEGADQTGAIIRGLTGTTLALRKSILGLDIISRLQLAEADGLVTTLAEPTLTALSGETASFLAGGEFPVPISQSLGSVTIEYKQYGVGLAFTPYRTGRRPHLDARPPGSQRIVVRRVDPSQRLQRAGADHAPRRDHRRAGIRPVVHDRRPAAQFEHQQYRQGPVPW